MSNVSGADTSLVEAAAIASRELEEEEHTALSTQQPSAEVLQPSLIHSDDGK